MTEELQFGSRPDQRIPSTNTGRFCTGSIVPVASFGLAIVVFATVAISDRA